jgi:predicted nucleic acid-binding protein
LRWESRQTTANRRQRRQNATSEQSLCRNVRSEHYRLVRVDRRDEAESLWGMTLRGTLPVSVKDATRRRVRRAAELKSKHAIAYADAFAVATAVEFNAILLTGDPQIEPLEGDQNLRVEWLPKRS